MLNYLPFVLQEAINSQGLEFPASNASGDEPPVVAITVEVDETASGPALGTEEFNSNLSGLLDRIEQAGIGATFFVDHRWVQEHPVLANRVAAVAAGIGLSLRSIFPLVEATMLSEELGNRKAEVERVLDGVVVNYARVPFALSQDEQALADALAVHQLEPVGWSHASRDWDAIFSDDEVHAHLDPVLESGGVVLFHASPRRTPQLIEAFVGRGSAEQFVTPSHPRFNSDDAKAGPDVTTSWFSHAGAALTIHHFSNEYEDAVAIVVGEISDAEPTLVRLHSTCLTSEVLYSTRCDCREQLDSSLAAMTERGSGVLIYFLDHEGRGIGLEAKLKAYALQDYGLDTTEANVILGHEIDSRRYDLGAEILNYLGISEVELVTNNPLKLAALVDRGFIVNRQTAWTTGHSEFASSYVEHKKLEMGHLVTG